MDARRCLALARLRSYISMSISDRSGLRFRIAVRVLMSLYIPTNSSLTSSSKELSWSTTRMDFAGAYVAKRTSGCGVERAAPKALSGGGVALGDSTSA